MITEHRRIISPPVIYHNLQVTNSIGRKNE